MKQEVNTNVVLLELESVARVARLAVSKCDRMKISISTLNYSDSTQITTYQISFLKLIVNGNHGEIAANFKRNVAMDYTRSKDEEKRVGSMFPKLIPLTTNK